MFSKKHPNLLSKKQYGRRLEREIELFYKEAEENLLQLKESYKLKDENEEKKNVKKRKVDDSQLKTAENADISPEENLVNIDCLRNHLCNDDLDEETDEILQQFESLPGEEQLQDPEEIIQDIMSHENDNSKFDFFDIIMKLKHDDDDIIEVESDDADYLDYLDTLMSLDEEDKQYKFMNKIRAMCIKHIHTMPHVLINELLSNLREETGYPFPKDARTFLKTPRQTKTIKMGDGEYCHYGIESALTTFLTAYKKKNIDVDCISLIANIDGATLANSTEAGSWIISVSDTILNLVEVTGIYDGEKKPEDSDDLVEMFVDELTKFINNGIVFEEKKYDVRLQCLVFDAPAKSYIMKTKLHSGYFSCPKCTIKGDWENKVIFPMREQQEAVLRTDEKFCNQEYEKNKAVFDEFQTGESIMKKIPNFKPISDVVIDYMHLICLGVLLKLIELWIKSPKCLLSDIERQQISDILLTFKEYMPSDFSRNPRQFNNVRRLWKAHELRAFLLYTGPAALYNILPSDLYLNFLCLHVAISILVNPILCKHEVYLNYAEQLLIKFVKDYEKLYGEVNMVFNIHVLLHLVDDVRRFGALDNFSAFRFENHIFKTKQLIRTGNKRLQQIAHRLMEIKAAAEYDTENNTKVTNFQLQPKMQPFQVVQEKFFKIDCRNKKDKYVLLDDGTYLECAYFRKDYDGKVFVFGHPFKTVGNFYQHPMPSSTLNINIIDITKNTKSTNSYLYQSISAKICILPFTELSESEDEMENVPKNENHKFVAVPIIHTYRDT